MRDNNAKIKTDIVQGYKIKQSVVFTDGWGFALAENPNAAQPLVSWQFTENMKGERYYYWGHYYCNMETAAIDFADRISTYRTNYGVTEKKPSLTERLQSGKQAAEGQPKVPGTSKVKK